MAIRNMMRLGLFLVATSLYAQSPVDTGVVARITGDLLGMKSSLTTSEPLKDEVYKDVELQSLVTYSQNKVMLAYSKDLFEVQRTHNRMVKRPEDASIAFRSFFSRDQAYKLTWVLAGKDLTEDNVKPLAEGIVGMAVSAVECRNAACPLQDSTAFRSAAEMAWGALRELGVSDADLRIVTDALFRGAKAAASPPSRATYK
jgi:hypothetical protein